MKTQSSRNTVLVVCGDERREMPVDGRVTVQAIVSAFAHQARVKVTGLVPIMKGQGIPDNKLLFGGERLELVNPSSVPNS